MPDPLSAGAPLQGEVVSPREYAFVQRIHDLEKEIIRLQEKQLASAVALSEAKLELARRLDELNHAHRDALAKEATFLSVTRFDDYVKEMKGWREAQQLLIASFLTVERFDDYVRGQSLWREEVTVTMAANSGKWGAYGSVFATALALASLLWSILRTH